MPDIFTTLIYEPFYNALVYTISLMPVHDLGLAIIVLTIAVKVLTLPFTHKGMKASRKMREIQGDIDKIKERHKDQKEQAVKIMNLYKEHGINPFSGCLFSFAQIPLIIGLYWVFLRGLRDGVVETEILYSFVHAPESINFLFLGFFDLSTPNVFLVLLAGITQFFQLRLSFPPQPKSTTQSKNPESFGDVFRKSFQTQTQYILPIVIVLVSFGFPGAVPLYWVTTNIFSIVHELIVKQKAALLVRS